MNARQPGFSMLEVVVAMILLSVILTALAGLTFNTAKQAVLNTDGTKVQAASLELVNRFSALPYGSLAGAAGCDTVGTVNSQIQRCVTVTTTGNSAQVQVVTTPLQRSAAAITVRFNRVAPGSTNPLCIGC
jgi:prepilin-type N-terminal cleavage/methylation domain-containing protein